MILKSHIITALRNFPKRCFFAFYFTHRVATKEKLQIGTLKALGFKNRRILCHYTSYGLFIGVVGTALGIGAYALILFIFRKRERARVFINSLCAAALSAFLALALLLFIANN